MISEIVIKSIANKANECNDTQNINVDIDADIRNEYGFDSLDIVDIMIDLEDKLTDHLQRRIQISDDEFDKLMTTRQIIEYVNTL